MYEGLKKQAAAVEMVGADKQNPSKVMGPRKSPIKKRGTGAASAGGTKTTNGKRGRPTKQKAGGEQDEGGENGVAGGGLTDDEDDEDEDIDRKRVKLEHGSDRPFFADEETFSFGAV